MGKIKSEQNDKELGNQNDRDQCDRIGCGVSCCNVLRSCGGDQGSERGSAGHTARDGAEVVQKAELQNVFCEQITDNQRNERHDHTVNEVHRVKVCNEFCAAGDTCADEEEYETEFSEELQRALRGHNADATDAAEVTEKKADEQTAARGRQGEASTAETLRGKRDLDLTDERTEDCREGERRDTHMVDLKDLTGEGLLLFFCFDNELCSLFFHISFRHLRNELNEENDADNAEDIGDTVTDGNETLILRFDRCLCRGERGGGCQRAGEQTDDHGNEAVLRFDGRAVTDKFTHADASSSGKTAGENDDHAEENVGLEVSLEVAEELRTCDVTDGGNEKNETEAFQKGKTGFKVVRCRGSGEYEIAECVHLEEERAKEQSDDEYACVTEGNALDRNSSEQIAEKKNRENHEKQRGNIADRNNAVK